MNEVLMTFQWVKCSIIVLFHLSTCLVYYDQMKCKKLMRSSNYIHVPADLPSYICMAYLYDPSCPLSVLCYSGFGGTVQLLNRNDFPSPLHAYRMRMHTHEK